MTTVKDIVSMSRKFENLKPGDKLIAKISKDEIVEGETYIISKIEYTLSVDSVYWKGLYVKGLPYLFDRLCCVNRFYTLKEYRKLKLNKIKNENKS